MLSGPRLWLGWRRGNGVSSAVVTPIWWAAESADNRYDIYGKGSRMKKLSLAVAAAFALASATALAVPKAAETPDGTVVSSAANTPAPAAKKSVKKPAKKSAKSPARQQAKKPAKKM